MTSVQIQELLSITRNLLVVTKTKEYVVSRELMEDVVVAINSQERVIAALTEEVSVLKRQLHVHRAAARG